MKAWRKTKQRVEIGDVVLRGRKAKNLLQALPTFKLPSKLFQALMVRGGMSNDNVSNTATPAS